MKLVLFDIDGTLLTLAEGELNVFGLALERVYGTSGGLDGYDFSGKTDHQIVIELLEAAGLDRGTIESGLIEMKSLYLEMLDNELGPASMTVLPGVRALLEALEPREEVAVGLQTGNWREAAGIKLERYGLARFFEVGAFGDGQPDRTDLPDLARRRAERSRGASIDPGNVIIIGDTALDVACAKHWEMASVAVATGRTEVAELDRAGADLVVSTLLEIDAPGLMDLMTR